MRNLRGLAAIASLMMVASSLAIAANAGSGQTLYAKLGCAGCHGAAAGSKLSGYPSLNALTHRKVASELNRYRSGARKDPTMNALARNLSDSEIEDIAAYVDSF